MEKNLPFQIQPFILLLAVLIISLPIGVLAQNLQSISGTIKNQVDNSPLPGVSVKVKGQTTGTSSNTEGRYRVEAKTGDILVFSSVGYQTKELAIGDDAIVDVLLIEDAAQLNEVVVTALGIERQTRTLTYATQQIGGNQLNEVRDNSGNVLNSLSGKIAGAVITPAATGPGGAARIVLRGNKSISGNNNALIVVDGVPIDNSSPGQPTGDFNSYGASDGAANINPDDIESMNVLKGPSAAALYGSRAANGAIIITTKKGKEGKVSLNYNGGFSVDQPNLLMKFQNGYGRGNGGVAGETAGESWGAPAQTYPNNVRSFFQAAQSYNNSLNLAGGTEYMQGYMSYTNNKNGGIIRGNDLDRNTLNLRVNTKLHPKLTTDAKITYVNQNIKNKPRQGDTGTSMEAYIMPRDMSENELLDFENVNPVTGQPVRKYWTTSSVFDNPYWDIHRTSVNEERNRITLMGSAKYQLADWLSIMGRYSLDRYDDKANGSFYDGTISLGNVQAGGQYYETYISRWERNIDVLLSGSNVISNDFNISYNVGASILNRKNSSQQNMANGLSLPNQFSLAFATTPSFTNIAPINLQREMQSVYGNVQIDFKKYLYLDASARNDWSSTLPSPHSYFYPSVGLSAILSDAIKMPNWVSFGKIRAAYTQVGNDAEPNLLSQLYSYNLGAGEGFVSRDMTRAIGNLKPEITHSAELGLEWKFFNNIVGLDATVYKSNTKNQLLFIGLPMASGYGQQYINAGNIENKGLELQITATPIKKEIFSWNTSINFARNINKIIELDPKISQADLSASTRLASVVAKTGGAYGDIYGYTWAKNEQGQHLVNESGLPIVTANQKIGNFNPDFTLGWNNTFQYKKFNLSMLIDGRVGGELVSGTASFLGAYGVGDFTEQWRDGGLVLPGITADGNVNTSAISAQELWTTVSQNGRSAWGEFFTYSTTNFRMRELSLSYSFDVKNSVLKDARIALVGRNLFFFYKGKAKIDIPGVDRTIPIDPEAALGAGNYQGVESGLPPSIRGFGINLKASF